MTEQNYSTNDGQEVTSPDALAIAEALDKALEYWSKESIRVEGSDRVAEFAKFCRQGAFMIY
jgi:hypothetical protein